MSKLDEMIKELCPDGVEYKMICDIVGVNRGRRLTKNQLNDSYEYEVYHGSKDTILGKYNNFNAPAGTVIVVNTGGIGGVKYLERNFWCSDGSFWLGQSKTINSKYLYYCLSGYEDYFYSKKRIGGVPTIDKSVVETFEIPVPPLEIQEEIVKTLDKFTNYVTELTARKLQYEHYRDIILSGVVAEERNLGDVCTFIRGPFGGSLKKECFKEYGYAVYEQQHAIYSNLDIRYFIDENKFEELNRFKVNPGDIIVSCSGTIGRTYIIPEGAPMGVINQALLKLTPSEEVNAEFIQFYFENNITSKLNEASRGGAIKNVPGVAELKQLKIFVPSLDEQLKIVDKLKRFSAVCYDISTGLPAEIEARQKQYEYYRDKLLSFERKEA